MLHLQVTGSRSAPFEGSCQTPSSCHHSSCYSALKLAIHGISIRLNPRLTENFDERNGIFLFPFCVGGLFVCLHVKISFKRITLMTAFISNTKLCHGTCSVHSAGCVFFCTFPPLELLSHCCFVDDMLYM